jgi:glycosyl transferase family 25
MLPVVCVINLARDVARWKKISAALEQQGFQIVRIRAIDARRKRSLICSKIGTDHYSQAMNRNLTPAECACALSHIAALKRILRKGCLYGIVMEDDAVMDDRFKRFVESDLERYLSKCAVVKIEGIENAPRKGLILERTGTTSLLLPFVPTQGSAAYAVTREGAQRLIKKFRAFSDPLDFMLSFYEWHGCTYGEVRPLLVQQDNRQEIALSSIQQERSVAYSGIVVRRSRLQAILEIIVHDVWRRIWRILMIARYALRYRTIAISTR